MAFTYPVKWITHSMRGAPPISGAAGTFIAALDAFLNTGWGSANAISVTISGGVGTAVFPEGVFFEDHAVVLFGGATTPAALNGEARVLSHTNNSITFETDAPDGVATTGTTITCRYAPVGSWSKPFTGTNKAVFRSADVQANGHYLRVDDSGTMTARVVGYEAMTDVDTGSGPFPTAAQIAGGGYVHKSVSANSNAVRYAMAADSRAVLWAIEPGTPALSTPRNSNLRGFGDSIPLAQAGDAWATFLSFIASSNTTLDVGSLSGGANSNAGSGATVCPRAFTGLGTATFHNVQPLSGGAASLSGADGNLGAAPSNLTGAIYLSRVFLKSQVSSDGPRSYVPGVVYVPQSGMGALVNAHDQMAGSGHLAGRVLLAIGTGANAGIAPSGAAFLDLTGPWR